VQLLVGCWVSITTRTRCALARAAAAAATSPPLPLCRIDSLQMLLTHSLTHYAYSNKCLLVQMASAV
jgi:hypothetical protein